jgi:hypothetical protein
MLVLDALFDHMAQISSNIEIIGSLVQYSPISAIDVSHERRFCDVCGTSALSRILTVTAYIQNR